MKVPPPIDPLIWKVAAAPVAFVKSRMLAAPVATMTGVHAGKLPLLEPPVPPPPVLPLVPAVPVVLLSLLPPQPTSVTAASGIASRTKRAIVATALTNMHFLHKTSHFLQLSRALLVSIVYTSILVS